MILALENWRTKESDVFEGQKALQIYRGLSSLFDQGMLTVAAMTVVITGAMPWFHQMFLALIDKKYPGPATFKPHGQPRWPAMIDLSMLDQNEVLQFIGLKAHAARMMIDAPTAAMISRTFHEAAGEPLAPTPSRGIIAHRKIILETGMKALTLEVVAGLALEEYQKHPLLLMEKMLAVAVGKYSDCEVSNCDQSGQKSYEPALAAARDELFGSNPLQTPVEGGPDAR